MCAVARRHFVTGPLAVLLLLGATLASAAEPDAFDTAAAVKLSQSVIGASIDDFAFQDRAGRRVTLSSYRGKPLLVSFVYTGCFQACPVATKFLASAVASAQRAMGPGSFNVVTIGFNLPFDTPQAMADFARRHAVALPDWEFLSPEAAAVAQLTQAFGFTYRATQGGFDHVTQVTLVAADGTIVRQIYGDSFELPLLIEPLKQLALGQAARFDGLAQMIEKVRLACTVYDPATGQYRFDYTVFIEIFAGLSIFAVGLHFVLRDWRRNRKQNKLPSPPIGI